MSTRASASRYARALLEVAAQESDVTRVAEELAQVIALIGEHRELGRSLLAPGVPNQARAGIVRALAERLSLAQPLSKVLELLATRGRLELLPEMATVYRERLLAHQNIAPAEVTTATPLGADEMAALDATLSRAAGAHVQMDVKVDPALIGGLVARVGGTVYDGSIRTQLQRMKQQLVKQG
ncbi:MAG: ATP synthase F1 subunit delta [Vicinamibacterales bacterium]